MLNTNGVDNSKYAAAATLCILAVAAIVAAVVWVAAIWIGWVAA